MNRSKAFILILSLFLIASIYVYWPLWQELQGRAVDVQMTKQTQSAQIAGKIDPTYTKLAEATGGEVCYSGGNTNEEKNENLKKCMLAIGHRDLVKKKASQIRERFLKIKSLLLNLYFVVIPLLYSIVFILVNRTRPVSSWVFSLACAVPAVTFWIYIGGIRALSDPSLNGRGGMNLPLAGAGLAAIAGFILSKNLFEKTTYEKNSAAAALILLSLIPCGFIVLLAGSC